MHYVECPLKLVQLCFHTEAFAPGDAPDDDTPAPSDLAYDAMVTHMAEVHGAAGSGTEYLVHQAFRRAVTA